MKVGENQILIFRVVLVSISFIFLITLTSCKTKDNNSKTADRYEHENIELSNYLCEKYDTELLADSAMFFTPDYQKLLLSSTVILDSLIHSITNKDGEFFLTAEVKSNTDTRIFARLKITEELYNSYSIADSSRVYLAVQINSVKTEKGLLESDTYFSNDNFSVNINDILLEGVCLEIIQQSSMLANDTLG